MQKRIIIFVLVFVATFFLIGQAVALDPLVPCGATNPDGTKQLPCQTCDVLKLVKNISDFILTYLVPGLATLLFLWAGFLILLGGGIPSQVKSGINIFKTTAYGIAIMMLAWLIVNTVLRTIAGDQNTADQWWKLECRENSIFSDAKEGAVAGETLMISGVELYGATANDAIIIWYTNKPATTQIRLADELTAEVQEKTIGHSVRLTGLLPNNTYEVVAISVDETGYRAESSPFKFTTSTGEDPALVNPEIGVALSFVTDNDLPDAVFNQNYSTTLRAKGGNPPYRFIPRGGGVALPPGLSLSSDGTISGKPSVVNSTGTNFIVDVQDSSSPPTTIYRLFTLKVQRVIEAACLFSGTNLCQGKSRPGGCGGAVCSQYLSSINKYAGGAATASLLKALMVVESDCIIKKSSGSSYGLMQLQPETANRYRTLCGVGVNEDINAGWLTSPQNADKSICIAVEYVKSIAAGTCGTQPRNIYAGYNGGDAGPAGACAPSVDCKDQRSCDGGAVRRWECLYDNPEHTICNGGADINSGYNQTKQGATYLNYCMANPGF